MIRLISRLGRGAAVVLGVVTLTFFLLRLAPGDPVARLVGPGASAEQLASMRAELGFDDPLPLQYAAWLGRVVTGDFGTSVATGRPVIGMLGDAWPATVLLVGTSLTLSYLLGIGIGAIQAATRRRSVDSALSIGTVTLFAMPGYWLGLMLVLLFAWRLRVLPAFGDRGLDADFLTGWALVTDRLAHLTLPLVTLTLIGLGGTARFVRGAMRDVRTQSFVTTAFAKGVRRSRVVLHHILRNALIPVVTLLGLSLPALFSGAVFIEAIFAWPGVGLVLVQAVQARDYPVVMAATTVSAVLVVAGNLLADLLAQAADPRLRGIPSD